MNRRHKGEAVADGDRLSLAYASWVIDISAYPGWRPGLYANAVYDS